MNTATKTIPFPTWTDNSPYHYFIKDIVGVMAMWAVRQSPYAVPANLEDALKELTEALKPTWKGDQLHEMHGNELRDLIAEAVKECPSIEAWNVPEKGDGRGFVTRFGGPEPDYDFIDIDALIRNVTHSLIEMRVVEKD